MIDVSIDCEGNFEDIANQENDADAFAEENLFEPLVRLANTNTNT